MDVVSLEKIKRALAGVDVIPAIEAGFVAYSSGRSAVPPVGELILPLGEVHIKYGFIRDEEHYVIKIASGFYENPRRGLPSSQGMMLLFNQRTGQPVCLLHDQGYLTDVRTAAAGAIAARYLAPRNIERIGIVGTGVQARMQLEFLLRVVECQDVLVWGRGEEQLRAFETVCKPLRPRVESTRDIAVLQKSCNLIVTTTPSKEPLLSASDLLAGTHITAVGSDTPHKQELESAILAKADVVVADSRSQCLERGEIYQAVQAGQLDPENVVELGDVIRGESAGRTSDDQITVADLTGVAVQDLQIAEAVWTAIGPP